jgi:deoxyguanosine kinase
MRWAKYIAVEGPPAVGKTTLTCGLAQVMDVPAVLEPEARTLHGGNSVLLLEPRERERCFALLHQRWLRQALETHPDGFVADFSPFKAYVHALAWLQKDAQETRPRRVVAMASPQAPLPSVVVYLHAPVEVLLRRWEDRGPQSQRHRVRRRLEALVRAYEVFFENFDDCFLLCVSATALETYAEQGGSGLAARVAEEMGWERGPAQK